MMVLIISSWILAELLEKSDSDARSCVDVKHGNSAPLFKIRDAYFIETEYYIF
jgi:hypothetical protein